MYTNVYMYIHVGNLKGIISNKVSMHYSFGKNQRIGHILEFDIGGMVNILTLQASENILASILITHYYGFKGDIDRAQRSVASSVESDLLKRFYRISP